MERQIMIITESIDNTADKVCYWLNYFGQKFVRFNTDLDAVWVHELEITQENVSIQLGHKTGIYNIHDFGIVWFRRGKLLNSFKDITNGIYPQDQIINGQINQHIQREINELNDFIYKYISSSVPSINNPLRYNINKLDCLVEASQIGLNIPYTLVTRSVERLKDSSNRKALITKNIGDILICHNEYFFSMQGTVLVDDDKLTKSPEFFQPSLFQDAITKIADVRVFFLFEEVFAVAILNIEANNQIDFRSLKSDNVMLYELSKDTKEQLLALAQKVGLESGSADFVLSQDNVLYFLEINPVGQVDFVSEQANLFIEKNIAKQLMKYGSTSKATAN